MKKLICILQLLLTALMPVPGYALTAPVDAGAVGDSVRAAYETTGANPDVMHAAERCADYLAVTSDIKAGQQVDAMIVFGSSDMQVPVEVARFYLAHKQQITRLIVVGGGNETTTEAVRYRDAMIAAGVNADDISIPAEELSSETASKNFAGNVAVLAAECARQGIQADDRATLMVVQNPFTVRRAALLTKQAFPHATAILPFTYHPTIDMSMMKDIAWQMTRLKDALFEGCKDVATDAERAEFTSMEYLMHAVHDPLLRAERAPIVVRDADTHAQAVLAVLQKFTSDRTASDIIQTLAQLENEYLMYRNIYVAAIRDALAQVLTVLDTQPDVVALRDRVAENYRRLGELVPFASDQLFPPYAAGQAPRVAVIIPIFNKMGDDAKSLLKKQSLVDNLHSLRTLRYPQDKLDVIIVDNGSPDALFAMHVKKEFPWITLMRVSTNQGFANGNNIGMEYALGNGAEYCFLINDDTYVQDPDIVTKLVRVAEREDVGLVSMPLVSPDTVGQWIAKKGLKTEQRKKDLVDTPQYEEVQAVAGSAFLVSKKIIGRVGVMDPRFFLYFEETDWNARVQDAGFRNVIVKTTRMVHKEEGGGVHNVTSVYYLERNMFFYYRRNFTGFYWRYIRPVYWWWDFSWKIYTRRAQNPAWRAMLWRSGVGLVDGLTGRWSVPPAYTINVLPPDEVSVRSAGTSNAPVSGPDIEIGRTRYVSEFGVLRSA